MNRVAQQRSGRQLFAMALVITAIVAFWGVPAPASAAPVTWVGSVTVVSAQEGGSTGLSVSYSHEVTYSLGAGAVDTTETTWSGQVHYSVKDYSTTEPCAGLVSHTFYDATGQGTGGDLLVTYFAADGGFNISASTTYIPIDVVNILYDCEGGSRQSIQSGDAPGPTPIALASAPEDATYLAGTQTQPSYCTDGGICITYETTYRLRHADCDQSRDTDGGGVSDCVEFDRGTDIADPTDDVPADSDGDGVNDLTDQCSGTPEGAVVDAVGCSVDSDNDGVPDGLDQCSATPAGAAVDAIGCSVDTDGDGVPDGIDQCSGTPTGAAVDAIGCSVDTDGDGVPDGIDQCPDTPLGTQVNALGCAEESGDCVGPTDSRGYTVAHYDADLNLRAAPDPDFFDWEVSAAWCISEDEVHFSGVDSFGSVTVDPIVATAMDLVGVTFRHDPDDESVFLTPVGGTTTGSVAASTDFDVCVNPASLLLAGGGRQLGELGIRAGSAIMGRMPTGGGAASWLDDMVLRVDDATLGFDEDLLALLDRAADPKRLGRLADVPLATSLWNSVSGTISSKKAQVSLAIRGEDGTNSLSEFADQGFRRFLDVYYDGERITIPRRDQAAARKLWNEIVADTSLQASGFLVGKIENLNLCGTVWRPVLTIYVPQAGKSFVDASMIDASVFDVKGGITVDTRP